MNEQIKEFARKLGEAIAASEPVKDYLAAKTAYETDATLAAAIAEYGAQRMALGEEQMKDTAMQDAELMTKIEARIGELYTLITTSDAYLNLRSSQEAINLLMQSVNSDINFYAFGERPCTHDCSTCSSDCASRG